MATIKSIGAKIAEIRREKSFTQEELAGEAGIDRSYVSDIERGKTNTTLAIILTISEVLSIDPKQLFD